MINTATGIEYLSQASHAYITVNWTASPSTDYVSEYAVTYVDTAAADPTPTTIYTKTNACKITALIPGHTYKIQVYARNKLGNYSTPSVTQTVIAALDTTIPDTPLNLSGTRAPRGANLNWTASTAKDIVGYNLQVSQGGAAFNILTDANSNALLIPGNTFYYPAPDGTFPNTGLGFQVRSVDATGNTSAWSSTFTVNSGGVYWDELVAGEIEATGTITGGSVQTQKGPNGQYVIMDANGIRMNDGTSNNYGDYSATPNGVTVDLNSNTGNAFFSGTVSASQIQGTAGAASGSGARMWIDLKDTAQGVGPLLDVNDGTYDRVQVGNLAANGVSPAQYGLRVNNTLGSPIMDAYGLIGAVTLAANSGAGSNFGGVSGSTPIQQTSSNTTFTIANRAQNVLILVNTSMKVQTGGGNPQSSQVWMNIGVVGQGNSTTITGLEQFNANNTPIANVIFEYPCVMSLYINLPIGSYTAAIYMANGNNAFAGYDSWDMKVLQLGG